MKPLTTEERLTAALRSMMDFHIHRYLMVNTIGRLDGSEKADQHLRLSYIYVANRVGLVNPDGAFRVEVNNTHGKMAWRIVHDATQELTDYMDEVIGFPLEEGVRPDYDELAPKFFDEFIRLADEAWDKIEDDIDWEKLERRYGN